MRTQIDLDNYEYDESDDNRNDVDYSGYDSAVEGLVAQAAVWSDERSLTTGANLDGVAAFSHKVEGNQWRPINSSAAGLDGWGEVHSSWVRLADSSDVTDGGNAKGDFQILFTAVECGDYQTKICLHLYMHLL